MANYMNTLVDPGNAMQGTMNTLATVHQLKQRDRSMGQQDRGLDLEERRLDLSENQMNVDNAISDRKMSLMEEQAYIESIQIPMQFQQIKSAHMAQMARKIADMPTGQRSARYKDLVTKVASAPVAEHKEFGPLGVVEPDYYIDPETFSAMSDEKQAEYLKLVSADSEALAEIDLADRRGMFAAEKIALEHEAKKDEILYGQQSSEKLKAIDQDYRMKSKEFEKQVALELKKYDQKNALELEKERQKRPPTSLVVDDESAQTLADQVIQGRRDITKISKRGGLQDAVATIVESKAPGFDFTGAEANAKYATNAGNLQSRALIQGVEPLYDRLLELGKKLNNSDLQAYNKARNWIKEETGNPDIVAFNNLRDDVIAESERVLLGSGVLSDSKYLRAVKNVSSAQSYGQLEAAVKNLRLTVKSRFHALNKAPFPQTNPNLPPAQGRVASQGSEQLPAQQQGGVMTARDYLMKFRKR